MGIPGTNYLVKLKGRSGFYFQRKVPKELQEQLGKTHWRWKAGNTLQEARRGALEALDFTDGIIHQNARKVTPELLDWVDRRPAAATSVTEEGLREADVGPMELFPRLPDEDAYAVTDRLIRAEKGEGVKTADQLIARAVELKPKTRVSTQQNYRAHLGEFMQVVGKADITQVTEEDALSYFDHQRAQGLAGSTIETRLKTVRGLFNVAKYSRWIKASPIDAIQLKYLQLDKATKKKKPSLLFDVDEKVLGGALPEEMEFLYWICRYTGCHISEAAGLRYEDIDLGDEIVYFRANQFRQLKTGYRDREVPMIPQLFRILSELKTKEEGFIWLHLYDKDRDRWADGMSTKWSRRIGISPKATRDAFGTLFRDSNTNRDVLKAIYGHSAGDITDVYGSVTNEAKLKAMLKMFPQDD